MRDKAKKKEQLIAELEEMRQRIVVLEAFDAERKRTEEALHKSEAKAHALLESAAEGIVIVNRDGRIVLVNAKTEEMFGYHRDELLGQTLEVLLPERFQSAHAGHRAAYFATPRVRPMGLGPDIAARRKDGSEFPIEVSLSFTEVEDGAVAMAFITDITDRKRAEKLLARQTEELMRSNVELEQFAYAASHDLQEPLRKVASYTDLLAKRYQGQLDSRADTFIAYIHDGATRMKALIDDLLTLSRIGNEEISLEQTDVQAVLREALAILDTALQESGASVTFDPLPTVMANPSQLEQLFHNLIGNAIKFRGTEPTHIHVSAEQKNHQCVFSVQDNGIGIDPQHAERIFAVFQRLHTRAEYPGTGIGLAICKKIVEHHGGHIWLESQPGKGATFYFTFSET